MKTQQYPVVIVGAGICGLSLGQRLKTAGVASIIVEKSAAPGGRFATRRTDGGIVDHGISWLESRGETLPDFVGDLAARGLLVRSPTQPGKWVSPMGMNQIAKHLAEGLTVEQNRRVIRISIAPGAENWHLALEGQRNLITASAIVCTQPVPQSQELLQSSFPRQLPGLNMKLGKIHYRPSLVLMGNLADDGKKRKFVPKAPFELIVRSEQKGLTTASAATTIYCGESFSRDWFDLPVVAVLREAKNCFEKTYGVVLESAQIKKWRYARAVTPCEEPFLMAPIHPALYFGGDGFAGGEIEGALRSAHAVATHLIRLAAGTLATCKNNVGVQCEEEQCG